MQINGKTCRANNGFDHLEQTIAIKPFRDRHSSPTSTLHLFVADNTYDHYKISCKFEERIDLASLTQLAPSTWLKNKFRCSFYSQNVHEFLPNCFSILKMKNGNESVESMLLQKHFSIIEEKLLSGEV